MMRWNTRLIAALALLVAAFVTVGGAEARLFRAQEQAPAPAAEAHAVPVPVVTTGCTDCCAPKYCIVYRKHHARRSVCCGCCNGPMQMMLQIQDPCTCCPIEIPVCVPGCCTDAPCVTSSRGLFGRTITEYSWCCGFRVRIVLTRSNTVIVHTYGA